MTTEDALQGAQDRLRAARRARRRIELDVHAAEVDGLEAQLEQLPPGRERDVLGWAARAERLRDIGYVAIDDDELSDAAATAEEGLAAVGNGSPDIIARLRLALGQVRARLHGRGWEQDAAEHYVAAARSFIEGGEPDEAAATLATLAWTVQLSAGTLRDARESLTEAVSLGQDPAVRAAMLSQRSQVHLWLGDLDAAQEDIEAAWPLAQEGDDRSVAYTAWAAATIASLRGQRALVEAWVRRGDRRRGSWADDNVTGLWYDAAVIDALSRVGAADAARDRLQDLLPEFDREPTAVGIAEVAFEARWGDPAKAGEAWEGLLGRPDLEPWDAARLRLLLAAARQGLDEPVGRGAAEAFEMCAGLEEPAVLLTLEPQTALELLPAAAAAGSRVARRLLDTRLSWRIKVLGGFAVARPNGEAVELTGRPRRLLMHLAVVGEPVTRQRLGRWLWPDGDDDAWRRARLRRLLHRTRSQVPDVVDTLPADRLTLSSRATVDLDLFTRAAARARAAQDPVVRLARVGEALEHFAGGLLPEEVIDDDWLAPARTRLARDATWLHTAMAEHLAGQGRHDLAVEHARTAHAIEPTNEAAAVLAADLLRGRGRRGQARGVLRAAEEALAALGLEPGHRLRAASTRLEDAER